MTTANWTIFRRQFKATVLIRFHLRVKVFEINVEYARKALGFAEMRSFAEENPSGSQGHSRVVLLTAISFELRHVKCELLA